MPKNNTCHWTCHWIGAGKAGPKRDARDSVAVRTSAGTRKHLATVAGTRETREQLGLGFSVGARAFFPHLTTPCHPLSCVFLFLFFFPSVSLLHKVTCQQMCSKHKTVVRPS